MSRAMKESGIDWIGKIPEDWEVHPLKHVLCERKEINNPITVEDILSLTNTRGVIPYADKGDIGNKSKEDISGYKIVRENDIVINSMNLYIGSVGLSKYIGVVSPVYYMLYKRNSNDSIDFYSQLFKTKELQSKSHGYGNGILDIRMRIPMSNLNLFPLPIPPSDEQHKIISVLNDRVDKIDCLIKIQEQQIERFEELKMAIVHKALTKGLNPNTLMKNSGQYMINQIPNDYQLFKIKHLCKIRNGKEIDFEGGHVPVYGSGGIFKYTNKALFNGKSVLLGRKGTIDKPQYVEGEFWTIDTAFYTHINENIIIPKFFYYATLVEIDFNFFKSGSVKPSMTQTDLGTIKIAVPSTKIQNEILEYVSIQEKRVDDFVNNLRLKIEKLNEYKNTLRYEYVTGKREV